MGKKKVKPEEGDDGAEDGDGDAGTPAAEDDGKKKSTSKKDKKDNKKDDDDDKEIGPEHGPRKFRQRGCTDCFCLILFFVFMLGMAYITYLAWTYGEPYQILYSRDYLGNRCGRGDFANRSKTIFPRVDQDLLEQAAIASTTPWRVTFYGLCVASCPNVSDPMVCIADPERCISRDYGTPEQWQAAGGSSYYVQALPTLDVLNRCVPTRAISSNQVPDRCAFPACNNITGNDICDTEIPSLWMIRTSADRARCEIKFQEVTVQQFATMQPSPIVARIADQMAALQRIVRSMMDAQNYILLFGLAAPVVLGLAWLLLLRFFAKTIVWSAIIAIGVCLAFCTLYLFYTSGAVSALVDQIAGNSTLLGGGLFGNITDFIQASTGIDVANVTAAVSASAAQANDAFVQVAPDQLTQAQQDAQTSNPFLYQVAAWVCLLLTVVYLIIMCLSRKKVALAACLVKEATVVVKDRPVALAFPFAIIAAQVPIVVYFLFIFLLLGTADLQLSYFISAADQVVTASSSYADVLRAQNLSAIAGGLPPDPWWVPAAILCYFLFGILWSLEFVRCTGFTALSGNVSDWYFFRRDEAMRSKAPLLRAFLRVVRYHLGSILFGSFIIALIQLIRIICAVIDQQTKRLQDQNQALKLAIKCAQICLYCFEKTIKFITNYCYIYVAMQGSGFCSSCFATFSLIFGQPAQLALNTLVRNILSLIQLIGIPAVCGWACHQLLSTSEPPNPEPVYPSGVVVFFALIITMAFSLVMSCALDTLFVCCIRDKVDYKGAFMSDALFKAFGFDKTERKEKRAAKKEAKAAKAEGSTDA